uniref:Ycf29 n=1 Tax=Harveyella mirabilis TaxID=282355 RepID=A0A3S8UW53_9FLOR|nr:hypothetical protein [Harveyella mirabilis]
MQSIFYEKNKRILLVDNDENLRNLLSSYLMSSGFFIYGVNNTRSALAIIRKKSPDLIISDIMMKDLNGYDLIRLVKFNYHSFHIPVVFLTAKGMTVDRIKGYNLGCYAYLIKPFDPNELLAIINNIFHHKKIFKETSLLFDNKFLSHSNLFSSFLFTSREQTILVLVIQGYMNKEIAINLNISLRNVEKYISRLLNKTSTRNRIDLMRLFLTHN